MIHPVSSRQALRLLKAGKAILTFRSQKTQKHFTYRISKAKGKDDFFFCSVLNGTDNYRNYQYFGSIRGTFFYQTPGSKISADAPSVKAFVYTWEHLLNGKPLHVDIFHEGTCCRCGRKLTVPESIQNGIGPECATHFKN